ncbi:MAG: stage II sporulation protein M [Defluviitaleaceae bacterium]|nr:stage II sporulation protein M [Defluviitaleaceae bacterium]
MQESTFIAKNEENWKALEEFNRQLQKRGGIKPSRHMDAGDVREFARLFRLASHHMAYAKTHFPGGQALPYLNGIVGVAHNYFYVREASSLSHVKNYFLYIFPKAVRESWGFWVAAAAFFALGMLFAGFYVADDLSRMGDIMPGFSEQQVVDVIFQEGTGSGVSWEYAVMAAFITTNNITVAFNAFALGMLAGLGTVFILVYNGLIVGGLFGFLHQSGANMLVAYALILPHGVMELMAIFLCGGAGLMLGKGMLIPGSHSRKHSLIKQAKKAATLIPGIITLLIIAGLIEGFFTPLAISAWAKIIFAGLTGVAMVGYFRVGVKKA